MLKFKMTEDGKSIMMDANGQPIVVDDTNPEAVREFSIDAIHLYHQIPKLKTDIQAANKSASDATTALAAFADITDPVAAIAALETVQNLKEGDLKKASDVQKKIDDLNKENIAKLQAAKTAHEAALAEKTGIIDGLNADLHKAVISKAFAESDWFNGKEPKSKLGPSVAESFLAKFFKVERLADGEIVPVAYIGTTRIEDPAKGMIGDNLAPMNFNDAMTKIIEQHPQAADILWPSSGSNSRGSKDQFQAGKKIIDGNNPLEFGENLADIASGKATVQRD